VFDKYISRNSTKETVPVRNVVLQICRRRARGQRSSSRGYSGQSDSFPRERQLQSILTAVLGRVLPRARFLFRFPNVRWFVCVLGVAHRASTGRWWIRHRSSSTSWPVLTLARH